MIRDVHPGSGSLIYYPSRIPFYPSTIPDQGVKKEPDPRSGFATLRVSDLYLSLAEGPEFHLSELRALSQAYPGSQLLTHALVSHAENLVKTKQFQLLIKPSNVKLS
jgi:hypothetical protein